MQKNGISSKMKFRIGYGKVLTFISHPSIVFIDWSVYSSFSFTFCIQLIYIKRPPPWIWENLSTIFRKFKDNSLIFSFYLTHIFWTMKKKKKTLMWKRREKKFDQPNLNQVWKNWLEIPCSVHVFLASMHVRCVYPLSLSIFFFFFFFFCTKETRNSIHRNR